MQALILASESPYRSALLARLGLEFGTVKPDIDESRLATEGCAAMAERLAAGKACAARGLLAATPSGADSTSQPVPADAFLQGHGSAAKAHPLIVASDQVAALGDQSLGKPLTMDNARAQLGSMSGQTIDFFTALHILHLHTGRTYTALDTTRVTLRELDGAAIERYLNAEKPLNCAGSFKVEAMGISLFESVHSEDPTALIGLPLISVCKGLRHFGWSVP